MTSKKWATFYAKFQSLEKNQKALAFDRIWGHAMIVIFDSNEKKDVAAAVTRLNEHHIPCNVQYAPEGTGDSLSSAKMVVMVQEAHAEKAIDLLKTSGGEVPVPSSTGAHAPSITRFYCVLGILLGLFLLWLLITLFLQK